MGYLSERLCPFPFDQYGSVNSLKIVDFGLVRRSGERDMPKVEPLMQTFTGTSVYMRPESVIDGKISAALDIWSLGCIVVEMMTGKLLGILEPEGFGD